MIDHIPNMSDFQPLMVNIAYLNYGTAVREQSLADISGIIYV